MNYTKDLINFIYNLNYDSLSEDTIIKTKELILDTLGVIYSGINSEQGKIWIDYIKHSSNKGKSYSPALEEYIDIESASMLNSALGHADDFDDLHTKSIVHPAVLTIPLALAICEDLELSGKDLIVSIVSGYEIACRVGEVINPKSYYYWHTTGVVASLTAAIVSGKLMKLSEEELLNSAGTAGTQASGLWQFLEDNGMSKSVHVARGVSDGLFSSKISKFGLNGAYRILEGEKGLIKALSNLDNVNRLTDDLGKTYKIDETSIKAYPCCRHTHSGIYAALKIKNRIENLESIASIKDYVYEPCFNITNKSSPTTDYDHKFSLQYCIAYALLNGEINKKSFENTNIKNKDLSTLMSKIEIINDKEINERYNEHPNQWIHKLEIELKNKDKLYEEIKYPYGDVRNYISNKDLVKKFRENTTGKLSLIQQDSMIDAIFSVENRESFKGFFEQALNQM